MGLRWDQRIAFNIGQWIRGRPLWLITDDGDFAKAAKAAGLACRPSAQDGRHFSTGVQMTRLSLVCKSGDRREVEIRADGVAGDPGGDGWIYYAWPVGVQTNDDEQYMASFRRTASDVLLLEFVTNRLPPEFQRCGLTSVLISHVVQIHSVRVCSSSNRGSEDESRNDEATGMWESMVRRGIAYYDKNDDRYWFHAPR